MLIYLKSSLSQQESYTDSISIYDSLESHNQVSQSNEKEKSSEISGILENIESQKNNIISGIGNIGYVQSIEIWEEMRNQCTQALSQTEKPEEKFQISQKIQELEGLEIEAFSQKITETMQESGWKESEEIYSTLLQKLQASTLQADIKQSFFAHLSQNLEITHQNIQEKNFLIEQEISEKNILQKSSYKKSIPEWGNLIKKYEDELKNTSIPKYKEKFLKKISEIRGKKFLAESYAKIKETKDEKTGENWKDSEKIYTDILSDTKKNTDISESEKNELKVELSGYRDIAKANINLKEKHGKLIEAEEKVKKLGYRKSQKYWKKLEMYYRFLKNDAKETEGSEQRGEDFATKETEMHQNTEISDLHGRLENSKENDAWGKSLVQYSRVMHDAEDAEIPKNEKQEILEKAHEYYDIADANREVKETLSDAKSEISDAVENLDWDESKAEHFNIQKYLQEVRDSVNTDLLENSRIRDLDKTMQEISENIKICTKEEKIDEQENKIFNPEKLSEENPQFAYLYKVFLATQYQKTDEKILEQKREQGVGRMQYAPTENTEQETPDTEISAEDIQQQQIQEQQQSDAEQITHTIDISASGISALDIDQASTQLENSIQNSTELQIYDSEQGILLNSQSSQNKYFAKSMLACLPPEISGNFTSSQIETYLSQKSQDSILKSQVVD